MTGSQFGILSLFIMTLCFLGYMACEKEVEETPTNSLTFAVFTPTENGWGGMIVTSEALTETDIEIVSDEPVIFSGFESYAHMGGKSECVFVLTSESEKITVKISSLDFTVELTGDKRITRS